MRPGGIPNPAAPAGMPAPLDIMGLPVMPFESYEHVLTCVEQTIELRNRSFCIAMNPIKIYRAWHEPELVDLLRRAQYCICDGVGVSIAARILHRRGIQRITGCDLFLRLLGLASSRQWGVYLLGASPQSNAAARSRLQEMYPNLRIVGSHDGFFEDSLAVVEQINASGADLLFVAMGSPKQEYWIGRHRDAILATFCMGVGGSFDIAAGSLRRAPKAFRVTGTEFLFRLMMEPRKRFSQQIILSRFLLRVIARRVFGPNRFVECA